MRLETFWGGKFFVAAALLTATTWFSLSFAQSSPAPFAASGVIEPEGGVLAIGTAATGVVERIVGGPGERVALGEELVKIDCTPLEANIKSLAGQAAAAKANADRVRNGPRPAEIAVGEANVGVARARAEEANDALQRAQRLQVGISVTQASLFQTERDARVTAAQLADARARLDLLKEGSRAEDIAEADAKRDAAAAALEEASAKLDQCSVRSPIEGVVVARFVSRGQFVSYAVPTILLELEADRSFEINASVDAARFADLCVGQHASVSLPGDAQALVATVERFAPRPVPQQTQPQTSAATVAVSLKLDQQRAGLVPGEVVSLRFEACRR
jgi:multidrug resistance efflux pump